MQHTSSTIALSLVLLTGCQSTEDNDSPELGPISEASGYEICSVNDKKYIFWEFLQATYLWTDNLPESLNLENFRSTTEILNHVRKQPEDRFSFITGPSGNNEQGTTVPHYQVFEQNGQKVAYLAYTGFVERDEQLLIDAMETLAEETPQAMILDLRENGGGMGWLGQYIATGINARLNGLELFHHTTNSSLTPETLVEITELIGDPMTLEQAIEGLESFRAPYIMDGTELELDMGLDQLIVLTSASTCSASELLINGLEPYMDVILIGEKTCGKPISFYPSSICSGTEAEESFFTAAGLIHNSEGVSQYFDGLSVDCHVDPVRTNDWGNTQDPSVAEALYYAQNGECR